MIDTQNENKLRGEIEAGLRRLAFGGISDGVRLLLGSGELSARQIKKLDLFNVACLKRGTGGVTEIKFYDRLKALAMLSDFDSSAGGSEQGLIEALLRSVESGDEP